MLKQYFAKLCEKKKLYEYKRIIYAIQALEFALIEQNNPVCVSEINSDTLNLAESYLRSKYKDPWDFAKNLESIIRLCPQFTLA